MRKWFRMIFAVCLAVLLLLCALPTAFAAEAGTEENPWKIGAAAADTVTAYIAENMLIIQGSGRMQDFAAVEDRPWNDAADKIEMVSFMDEVTNVGKNAFKGMGQNTKSFSIYPTDTLTVIGDSALEGVRFDEHTALVLSAKIQKIGARAFADTNADCIEFQGHPDVAADAFAGITADAYTVFGSDWTEADKQAFGGKLTYKNMYTFTTEEISDDDSMSGSSVSYIHEGDTYEYRADNSDGYRFDRWKVVSGDVGIEDTENPQISVKLTDNVKVKVYYTHAEENSAQNGTGTISDTDGEAPILRSFIVWIVCGILLLAVIAAAIVCIVRKRKK